MTDWCVSRDSQDRMLITVPGDVIPLARDTFIIRAGGPPQGPLKLGSFLNHVPSNWTEVSRPWPVDIAAAVDQVRQLIASGALTEESGQSVGSTAADLLADLSGDAGNESKMLIAHLWHFTSLNELRDIRANGFVTRYDLDRMGNYFAPAGDMSWKCESLVEIWIDINKNKLARFRRLNSDIYTIPDDVVNASSTSRCFHEAFNERAWRALQVLTSLPD